MKSLIAPLAAAVALLLVAGAAPALADGSAPVAPWGGPGSAPLRGGFGQWFQNSCVQFGPAGGSCQAQVVTNSAGQAVTYTTPPAAAYGPAQIEGAYSLSPDAPSASVEPTVAIVDAYNDPDIASDMQIFDSQWHLPTLVAGLPGSSCNGGADCFAQVNESGQSSPLPATNSGWDLEISLDVQTIHSICQNCNIILVEASSNSLADLGASENEAARLGANVITNSWGASEYASETSDSTSYFDHPGIAITASAGDDGYGVLFPAASPYVTAVGGTTLDVVHSSSTATGYAYGSESAWGYESNGVWYGTGAGCSRYVPKPSWQTVTTDCAERAVTDVSADADPNTGLAVYDSVAYEGVSGWFQVGGTSLSAQLIGAVYALTGNTSGITGGGTPYLHSSLLHDVTSGSNGSCGTLLCNAGAGWDGPTGLGSPDGIGAFEATAPPPPTPGYSLSVSPSSRTVAAGSATSFSVTVTPSGGFSGNVSLSASGAPSGAVVSPGSADVTSSSPVTVTLNVTTSASEGASSSTLTFSGAYTGTEGTLSASTTATLVVTAPSFTLAASAPPTLAPGRNVSSTVTVTPSGGFSGTVSLAASGLPAGVTASFSPNPTSSRSTLTFSASASAKSGSTTITITGTSGSLVRSTTVTLVVAAGPGGPGGPAGHDFG